MRYKNQRRIVRRGKHRSHREFRYFGVGCAVETSTNGRSIFDVIWREILIFHVKIKDRHAVRAGCHSTSWPTRRKYRWGRDFLRSNVRFGFCGTRSIGLVAFTKIDMMLYCSLWHIWAPDTNVRRSRFAVCISSCSISCTRNSENIIVTDIFLCGEPNWGRFSIIKILLLKYILVDHGFRAESILSGPRDAYLPALQSLQVPIAGANVLEKPIERYLDRKCDKPKAPFVLVFKIYPGPRRRKRRDGRCFGTRGGTFGLIFTRFPKFSTPQIARISAPSLWRRTVCTTYPGFRTKTHEDPDMPFILVFTAHLHSKC